MTCTWLISDTHFGHKNSLNFKRSDGTQLRPFLTVEEMDELMVQNWNAVIRPKDRVYHLGDVAMNRRCVPIMERLHGRKALIAGNHDLFHDLYAQYFDYVAGSQKLGDFILSHIPLHSDQFRAEWCGGNIHGHLHSNFVAMPCGTEWDRRYFNVSVESPHRKLIGYKEFTPINFDDIVKWYKNQN